MRAAALDLSSRTGVAVWDGVSAIPRLQTKKITGYDFAVEDMLEFWRVWLLDFLKANRPELVAIEENVIQVYHDKEDPNSRPSVNGQSVFRLCALSGFTRWACKKAGARIVCPTPNQWRKHAFGSARHNGTDWKQRARQRIDYLGWEADSHDAAEAGLILDWALCAVAKVNPIWRDDTFMARIP